MKLQIEHVPRCQLAKFDTTQEPRLAGSSYPGSRVEPTTDD